MSRVALTKLNADSLDNFGAGVTSGTTYRYANNGTTVFLATAATAQTVTVIKPTDGCGDQTDETYAVDSGGAGLILGPFATDEYNSKNGEISMTISGAGGIHAFSTDIEA